MAPVVSSPSARPIAVSSNPSRQHLTNDVTRAGPERDANANLAATLHHDVREDAVEAQRGERRGDRSEGRRASTPAGWQSRTSASARAPWSRSRRAADQAPPGRIASRIDRVRPSLLRFRPHDQISSPRRATAPPVRKRPEDPAATGRQPARCARRRRFRRRRPDRAPAYSLGVVRPTVRPIGFA
jgi:hypothetical protein